jgi:hypothetical protein
MLRLLLIFNSLARFKCDINVYFYFYEVPDKLSAYDNVFGYYLKSGWYQLNLHCS